MYKIISIFLLLASITFCEKVRLTEQNILDFYVKIELWSGLVDYEPIYFDGRYYSLDNDRLSDRYTFKELITIIKKRKYELVRAEEFETVEIIKKDVRKDEKMDGTQ